MGNTISVVFLFYCILRNGGTSIEYITVRSDFVWLQELYSAGRSKTRQSLVLSRPSSHAVAVKLVFHISCHFAPV